KVSPFALHVNEVVLNEYFANIFVAKDGTVNLARVVKKDEQPKKEQKKQGPPPDIKIKTVTLQGGVLAFEDESLDPRKYGTRFVKLGGRVSGLSSEKGTRAGLDLRGMLENHSPLRISGEINPLSDPLYVNVKVDFDNIELPRLTPYSATYLGYRIEQGKLHTEMNYKVENNRIDANNRILIDQLFFGEKVQSDKATNLPVPAAVGLLKDRNGQIQLDVPVTGNTDDPKFSFGDAIRQAIKGTFSKLFTNPFAFLGAGAEDFRTIYFEFGRWTLSDNEKKKLDAVAKKLDERPGLKVDVMGYVDREQDVEPFRQHLVNEKLRMEKYLDTVKSAKDVPPGGQIPDNIRIEKEEYSRYLKRAYNRADFPKPRKTLPDEEMRKLLLAHTLVGEAQLTELSRMRSLTVRDYLAAKGGVEQSRMFLKVADIFAAPSGVAKGRARVEFGLAGVKGD
ncbi:MAG TPA: DUF748 domain-containing protein, partial [Verrucomicrobiae bacterium]|nr:DUF748 domain-containing protein [Verrucomicrobiae bacterium]